MWSILICDGCRQGRARTGRSGDGDCRAGVAVVPRRVRQAGTLTGVRHRTLLAVACDPMTAVLDHLAVGTRALPGGWELFGGLLGGTWAGGGASAGFWWGQLEFAAGPKIELLTPAGGPGAAFPGRFLAARGAGPHHFTFLVTDIDGALARIRASGIEPIGVNLADPRWREAFLHPRDAHGIVIQVARQAG